jgi:WD40 repeat protein
MRHQYVLGLLCAALVIAPARAQDAKPFARLEVNGKFRWITDVAFSTDTKTFAAIHTHSHGPTFVTLFDATTGKRIRQVEGPEGVINWNPVQFSPNGKLFAVGGCFELLLFHADGKRAHAVDVKDAQIESLAFSPNSAVLATGSWITPDEKKDNKSDTDNVCLWNVVTKETKTNLQKKASARLGRERVVGLAVSPDAKSLVAVGHDCDIDTGWMVRVWVFSTLKPVHTFTGKKKDRFESVELSRDGRFLAVLKKDLVELWNTSDGKLIRTIKSRGEDWNMHFTKDGSAIVVVNYQVKNDKAEGAEIEMVDVQSGKVLANRKLNSGPNETFFGPNFAISPAGDMVAFQVDINEFALWRSKTLVGVPLKGKQKE